MRNRRHKLREPIRLKRDFHTDSSGLPVTQTGLDHLHYDADTFQRYRNLFAFSLSQSEQAESAEIEKSIRHYRRVNGWSRIDLARLLNMPIEEIVAIENQCGNPDSARDLLLAVQHLSQYLL